MTRPSQWGFEEMYVKISGKLETEGKDMEQLMNFQYLRTDVCSDQNSYEEARNERDLYFRIFKGFNLINRLSGHSMLTKHVTQIDLRVFGLTCYNI